MDAIELCGGPEPERSLVCLALGREARRTAQG
jgi:hypothetical protein